MYWWALGPGLASSVNVHLDCSPGTLTSPYASRARARAAVSLFAPARAAGYHQQQGTSGLVQVNTSFI
jgi:hypothetical protein